MRRPTTSRRLQISGEAKSAAGQSLSSSAIYIAPFTPPPLAELDKTAEWIDHPVLSGMEIMRKKQEALGPPPVSVEEALDASQ